MDIKIETHPKDVTDKPIKLLLSNESYYPTGNYQLIDIVINDDIWFPISVNRLIAAVSAFEKLKKLNNEG